MRRRSFFRALTTGAFTCALPLHPALRKGKQMYGLIGKINVAAGQRELVVAALLEGTRSMPGCLSYVVAQDPADPNAIWVTEVWDSRESHGASLKLPAVQQAIATARPHITGFGERFETVPVGGHGLKSSGA